MTVTLATTSAQPQTTDNQPVRIAVTDRGSIEQRVDITLLLECENVVIEWITSENVDEVGAAIDKGKIDGILLSAWEEQDPQAAIVLDQRLLEQNRHARRPVPLLAIREGMLSLARHNGGKLSAQPRVGNKTAYSVAFRPRTHLYRWVNMEEMWVPTAHPLPDFTIPPRGPVFINAWSYRGGEGHIEGIEVVERGTLHVGVDFDPATLAQPVLTENIAPWLLTILGARNIINGFVAEVRDHTGN